MLTSYRPSSADIMRMARDALDNGAGQGALLRHFESHQDIGPAPEAFTKPPYGTPAYAIARKVGWISQEQENADRAAFEQRRARSLQTCHRYSLYERPRAPSPRDTGAYAPPLSARLTNDPNLTDGARRCAAKLAEYIYRLNREGRFMGVTVTYLMEALGRSRRTIQRYLRILERERYIRTEVILSDRSRMCTGLEIALCERLFPHHHRKQWPKTKRNPGVSQESHKNRFFYLYNKDRPRISVHLWALKCMDGVYNAFMKTDPLGLMEKSAPG